MVFYQGNTEEEDFNGVKFTWVESDWASEYKISIGPVSYSLNVSEDKSSVTAHKNLKQYKKFIVENLKNLDIDQSTLPRVQSMRHTTKLVLWDNESYRVLAQN